MSAGFILDGVVAALLAATITYCFILYRRLNVLREASAEMRQVLAGFNAATARAQAGEDAATEGGTVVPLATAPGGAGAGLGADEEITVESEAERELLSTLRRTR